MLHVAILFFLVNVFAQMTECWEYSSSGSCNTWFCVWNYGKCVNKTDLTKCDQLEKANCPFKHTMNFEHGSVLLDCLQGSGSVCRDKTCNDNPLTTYGDMYDYDTCKGMKGCAYVFSAASPSYAGTCKFLSQVTCTDYRDSGDCIDSPLSCDWIGSCVNKNSYICSDITNSLLCSQDPLCVDTDTGCESVDSVANCNQIQSEGDCNNILKHPKVSCAIDTTSWMCETSTCQNHASAIECKNDIGCRWTLNEGTGVGMCVGMLHCYTYINKEQCNEDNTLDDIDAYGPPYGCTWTNMYGCVPVADLTSMPNNCALITVADKCTAGGSSVCVWTVEDNEFNGTCSFDCSQYNTNEDNCWGSGACFFRQDASYVPVTNVVGECVPVNTLECVDYNTAADCFYIDKYERPCVYTQPYGSSHFVCKDEVHSCEFAVSEDECLLVIDPTAPHYEGYSYRDCVWDTSATPPRCRIGSCPDIGPALGVPEGSIGSTCSDFYGCTSLDPDSFAANPGPHVCAYTRDVTCESFIDYWQCKDTLDPTPGAPRGQLCNWIHTDPSTDAGYCKSRSITDCSEYLRSDQCEDARPIGRCLFVEAKPDTSSTLLNDFNGECVDSSTLTDTECGWMTWDYFCNKMKYHKGANCEYNTGSNQCVQSTCKSFTTDTTCTGAGCLWLANREGTGGDCVVDDGNPECTDYSNKDQCGNDVTTYSSGCFWSFSSDGTPTFCKNVDPYAKTQCEDIAYPATKCTALDSLPVGGCAWISDASDDEFGGHCVFDCSTLNADQIDCDMKKGCAWVSPGICVAHPGPIQCSDYGNPVACNYSSDLLGNRCVYLNSACTQLSTSCGTAYTEDECRAVIDHSSPFTSNSSYSDCVWDISTGLCRYRTCGDVSSFGCAPELCTELYPPYFLCEPIRNCNFLGFVQCANTTLSDGTRCYYDPEFSRCTSMVAATCTSADSPLSCESLKDRCFWNLSTSSCDDIPSTCTARNRGTCEYDKSCFYSRSETFTGCIAPPTDCSDYITADNCTAFLLDTEGKPKCFWDGNPAISPVGSCESFVRDKCDLHEAKKCSRIALTGGGSCHFDLATGKCEIFTETTCANGNFLDCTSITGCYWGGSSCVAFTNVCSDYSTSSSCETYPLTDTLEKKCYWNPDATGTKCLQRSAPCAATNKYDCQSTGACVYTTGSTCELASCSAVKDGTVCQSFSECDQFSSSSSNCGNYIDPTSKPKCDSSLGKKACLLVSGECDWDDATGCAHKACSAYATSPSLCTYFGDCDQFGGSTPACSEYIDATGLIECSTTLGKKACATGACVWSDTIGCDHPACSTYTGDETHCILFPNCDFFSGSECGEYVAVAAVGECNTSLGEKACLEEGPCDWSPTTGCSRLACSTFAGDLVRCQTYASCDHFVTSPNCDEYVDAATAGECNSLLGEKACQAGTCDWSSTTGCSRKSCSAFSSDPALCQTFANCDLFSTTPNCNNYVAGKCSASLGKKACFSGECDWVDGTGCKERDSKDSSSKSNAGLVVAIVVPIVVVLITASVLIIVFVLYKKKKACFSTAKVEDNSIENNNDNNENVVANNESIHEDPENLRAEGGGRKEEPQY